MPRYNVKSLNIPAEWGGCEADNANKAAEKCAEWLYDEHPRQSYDFRVSCPERHISCEIRVFVANRFFAYGNSEL